QLSPAGDLRLAAEPQLPQVVTPGAALELVVVYRPNEAGPDGATISVTSDDPDEPTVNVDVTGVGGIPTTCSLSIAPSQVTFGLVERGRRAVLPVEVRNAGAQSCSVDGVGLRGDGEFTLDGAVRPSFTIAPGAVHRIPIAYRPTVYGDHRTELTFTSDDPGQRTAIVPISGASTQTSLLVVPSSVDFNVVPVTCGSPQRQVIAYNTGTSVITLNNIYLDVSTTPEFQLTPVSTPVTLRGGQSVTLDLLYRPTDLGADTGLLLLASSNAQSPVAVPLAGEGRISPTVTDRFTQLSSPQADVLFVVDDSGSMAQEQRNLGRNLSSFLSFAIEEGIDYHIAVTTTDANSTGERGRFVPILGRSTERVISPQTVDPSAVFERNTNVGTAGSGTERGMEAAFLALSDPLINTSNTGFLRRDAALAVIFVSDESDSSNRSVNFYENFLRNLNGFRNPSKLSVSAVVGTTNPICESDSSRADYAPRYIDLAERTGGVVESICSSNWGQTLSNIGRNSFGLRRQFSLSSRPVPQTVAVLVNGVLLPRIDASDTVNWTFDTANDVISFAAMAVPPPGAIIEVTYAVACLGAP
ncbi:MAG: choice-of-anchor D domain-containing protein, partial [Myxococcota bacterium]